MVISVIGLGRLGLGLAGAIAHKGHKVMGFDSDVERIANIRAHKVEVLETDVTALHQCEINKICFAQSCEDAIADAEIVFLCVPTPSTAAGDYDTSFIARVLTQCGEAQFRVPRRRIYCVCCTVTPGVCRNQLMPALEAAARERAGLNFDLCYNPQLVALGSLVRDFLRPSLLILGAERKDACAEVASFYKHVHETSPDIPDLNLTNAEITKIAINCFVTVKMSFANMIGELCESLPTADVDAVTLAVGADPRIGRRNLTAGLGYGGPCFPRDNVAFERLAHRLDMRLELPGVIDRYNRSIPETIIRKLKSANLLKTRIAVLGIGYKSGANVIDACQALEIAELLAAAGTRVTVYDPTARLVQVSRTFAVEHDLESCVGKVDTLVLTSPDTAFSALSEYSLEGKTVMDIWRVLQRPLAARLGSRYIACGIGVQSGDDALDVAGISRLGMANASR